MQSQSQNQINQLPNEFYSEWKMKKEKERETRPNDGVLNSNERWIIARQDRIVNAIDIIFLIIQNISKAILFFHKQ